MLLFGFVFLIYEAIMEMQSIYHDFVKDNVSEDYEKNLTPEGREKMSRFK